MFGSRAVSAAGRIVACGATAALFELRPSSRLARAAGAVGCFQRGGGPCAATSVGGVASSGRASSPVVGRSGGDRSVDTVASPIPTGRFVHYTWHRASLARRSGEATLDLQTGLTRSPADASHDPRTSGADGHGEPWVGLPEDRGGTGRPAVQGCAVDGVGDLEEGRDRSGAVEVGAVLGSSCVPSPKGSSHVTSSMPRRSRSPGCTASRSSNTPPAGSMSWASPRIRRLAGLPSRPGI